MIKIKPSPHADTRSCDFANVTIEQLRDSSKMHIHDVQNGMQFFRDYIQRASNNHDWDKLEALEEFHADFVTGFKQTSWWDNHRKVNRHHLAHEDGIPNDVNLLDVLEYVADCTMAGMARSGAGGMYTPQINPDVLMRAFENTVALLKAQVIIEECGTSDASSEATAQCPSCQAARI